MILIDLTINYLCWVWDVKEKVIIVNRIKNVDVMKNIASTFFIIDT